MSLKKTLKSVEETLANKARESLYEAENMKSVINERNRPKDQAKSDPVSDEEKSQTFDQAEVHDDTNKDDKKNPEAKSPEGKEKVKRVYEAAIDVTKQAIDIVKKNEKINNGLVAHEEKFGPKRFAYVIDSKGSRAYFVDVKAGEYESVDYNKTVKKFK